MGQFLSAFVQLASWPAHTSVGLIFFLPSVLFLWRGLESRPALNDPRWFNIMALGWVLTQILAIAVGRAQLPLQYRYFDILLVGLTINLVSAFWVFQSHAAEGKRAIWRSSVLAAWLCVLALSLTHPQRHLPDKIEEWRTILATGSRNVQRYLATGDASFLARTPAAEVPAFDPGRLRELLDTPEIRSALPPELLLRAAPHTWVEAFKSSFLRLGALWLSLGTLALASVVAQMALAARREAQSFPADSAAPQKRDRTARVFPLGSADLS
jgi:hypothetical protein